MFTVTRVEGKVGAGIACERQAWKLVKLEYELECGRGVRGAKLAPWCGSGCECYAVGIGVGVVLTSDRVRVEVCRVMTPVTGGCYAGIGRWCVGVEGW